MPPSEPKYTSLSAVVWAMRTGQWSSYRAASPAATHSSKRCAVLVRVNTSISEETVKPSTHAVDCGANMASTIVDIDAAFPIISAVNAQLELNCASMSPRRGDTSAALTCSSPTANECGSGGRCPATCNMQHRTVVLAIKCVSKERLGFEHIV